MIHYILISLVFFGAPAEDITRISFGSCSNEKMESQPLWQPIMAGDPQLWIWLGDIVYADSLDTSVLQASYAQAKAVPDYATLRKTVPVIGTWDDHDYGLNDGGKNHPNREGAQTALLDFLDVPQTSPRRKRQGVYNSHIYGKGDRLVRVILLDTRYFRDDPGPEGDVLGEAQWQWLESQLTSKPTALTIIGSSIQVIPMDHRFEKWSNFPKSRVRLLALLAKHQTPGVILLSGDRHIAEISRIEDSQLGYPLYEITSSGLTHAYLGLTSETNRYRVGELYQGLNFGTINIDWDAGKVHLRVHEETGAVIREVAGGIPLASLRKP